MPSLGFCSTRKTSCHRVETARAIAHPTTPPPIITMLAWSINRSYPRKLAMRIDFVEEWFAFRKPRLRPIMHRIHRVPLFLVMIAPQRRSAVHPILIQRIEENVKRRQLLLVVVVIARNTRKRLEASLLRRFPAPHHLNNRVPAGNFDVFFAFARRARRAHLIVHTASRPNNRRITHASWNFPSQPRRRSRRRNISSLIHRHAWDRSCRRMRNYALRIRNLLFVMIENRRNVFFPFRAIDPRPPVHRR